jgi:hypothetical protein
VDTAAMQDLRVALRWIRDAGMEVCDKGWEHAALMDVAVDRATPIVARSYELPGDVAIFRGQLAVDCEAWCRLSSLSQSASARSEFRGAGVKLARRMVDRSDALLAWLQGPKG